MATPAAAQGTPIPSGFDLVREPLTFEQKAECLSRVSQERLVAATAKYTAHLRTLSDSDFYALLDDFDKVEQAFAELAAEIDSDAFEYEVFPKGVEW